MARKENRHDKFVRLAETRTQKALDAIRLIGNLSNRATYEFSDAEIRKIFKALDEEMKAARERFSQASGSRASGFTLK
jgi:hypothetical protein